MQYLTQSFQNIISIVPSCRCWLNKNFSHHFFQTFSPITGSHKIFDDFVCTLQYLCRSSAFSHDILDNQLQGMSGARNPDPFTHGYLLSDFDRFMLRAIVAILALILIWAFAVSFCEILRVFCVNFGSCSWIISFVLRFENPILEATYHVASTISDQIPDLGIKCSLSKIFNISNIVYA